MTVIPPESNKQKKRKHVEEVSDKGKTNAKKVSDEEKEKKAKKREENKRKKEEDQEKQKTLLETRKAQAAARWATNSLTEMLPSTSTTGLPTSFDDITEPGMTSCSEITSSPDSEDYIISLKSTSTPQQTTSGPKVPSTNRNQKTPRQLTISHCTPLPPTSRRQETPRQTTNSHCTPLPPTSRRQETPRQTTNSHCTPLPTTSRRQETPRQTTNSHCTSLPTTSSNARWAKNGGETRRGLHFQNSRCIQETSSEDEDDVVTDADKYQQVGSLSQNECCREKSVEISALRKRLEKLHRRLNIALKAKTSEEVGKNRPGPGVIDKSLANEYEMTELIQGSGVFWYPHQRAYCSAYKNWSGYLNAAVDIFFSKDTLADSCAMGSERNAGSRRPLNPLVIQALIGKVCSKYINDNPTPSQVVQKINMKCVEARRPQRLRASKVTSGTA